MSDERDILIELRAKVAEVDARETRHSESAAASFAAGRTALKDIRDRLVRMEHGQGECKEDMADHEARIRKVETQQAKFTIIVAGITFIASGLAALAMKLLLGA